MVGQTPRCIEACLLSARTRCNCEAKWPSTRRERVLQKAYSGAGRGPGRCRHWISPIFAPSQARYKTVVTPTLDDIILPVTPSTLFTALQMTLTYLGLMFLGARHLPALERKGYALIGGQPPLDYNLTGLTLFVWTHIVVGVLVLGFGWSLTPLITHFWSLFIVVNAVAVIWSVALFFWGRRRADVIRAPAEAGRMPRVLADMWFGNELNPRWMGVDLKMFMYQPSLIGVGLMVAAFAFAQRDVFGTVTPQMLCFVAFWWLYLWTHYVKEEFMLSTWDVIAENFGFMLVWGDLVYVPFLYSLPGWFILIDTDPFVPTSWVALSGTFLFFLFVFRQSNWQKERYKRNPTALIWGRPAEALEGRLLISGWWGIARKFNYTAEIGVYICFSLCAGFVSVVPYIVPLSLIILLTQRAHRDDRRCRNKYGELWATYCRRVPYRMLPFVY